MQELKPIKKAIILYTAVTVIEQLLIEKKNFNFLYPLKKKRQLNRNKRTGDLMGML